MLLISSTGSKDSTLWLDPGDLNPNLTNYEFAALTVMLESILWWAVQESNPYSQVRSLLYSPLYEPPVKHTIIKAGRYWISGIWDLFHSFSDLITCVSKHVSSQDRGLGSTTQPLTQISLVTVLGSVVLTTFSQCPLTFR